MQNEKCKVQNLESTAKSLGNNAKRKIGVNIKKMANRMNFLLETWATKNGFACFDFDILNFSL